MYFALETKDIYLVGDTHSVTIFNQLLDSIPEGATIIHVGDCAICKGNFVYLEKLNKHAKRRKQKIAIIRGNHDDPFMFPHYGMDNVKLIPDYQDFQFPNGITMMAVGGGISLNRMHLKIGKDYWPDEITLFKPELCKKVDILILHDAPSYFNNQTGSLPTHPYFGKFVKIDQDLIPDCSTQRDTIDKIVAICKPKYIFGGHFHNSVSEELNNIRYRCLTVNEILHLDTGLSFAPTVRKEEGGTPSM